MPHSVVTVFLMAGLLLGLTPILAHHASGLYEESAITLKGTVADVKLLNPRTVVFFDVLDNGKTIRWQGELFSRTSMTRDFGWAQNTVKVGDKITVTGHRAKSGAPNIDLTEKATIVLTNTGKELFNAANQRK